MKNIAVIPVRGGSKRVPQKNFIDFFGKPMFVHTYDAAAGSGLFEDIIVSTESFQALEICQRHNISVPFLRPDYLCSDEISLNDVCLHVLHEMKKRGKVYDNMCLLWATAPMRDAEDIKKAYDILINEEETEAVIGVTDCYQYYPAHIVDAKGYIQPLVCLDNMTTLRGQEAPKTFVDNGSLSWVRCEAFLKQRTWMPKKSRGYYMPVEISVDLDHPHDLELLEFYYQRYLRKYRNIEKTKDKPLANMKRVFFDTEFTRGGQNTTLISIGFASQCGETLYIELNDYDHSQVTAWLEENILSLLEGNAMSTKEACQRIEKWFNHIAPDQYIQLISPGKDVDNMLLYNLWAKVEPGSTLRSWHNRLPAQIDHRLHLDMDTIFTLHGIDPSIDRAAFIDVPVEGRPHMALYDAKVLKICWEKLYGKRNILPFVMPLV